MYISDKNFKESVSTAEEKLKRLKSHEFNNYTGWMKAKTVTNDELKEIKKVSDEIKTNSDVLVVIGIGGSYLGAKAVIEALTNKYTRMEIIYLGNSVSALDMRESLDYLKTKDFSVNVISKSGETLEPAIAFELVKDLLYDKYGEKALERIIVTTDKIKGSLRKFVEENNVKSFVIPDSTGGRYSVLTPVGLLPMAVAGIDIESVIDGARDDLFSGEKEFVYDNAIKYACYRNIFNKNGLDIELLVTYEPRLKYFGEWWKQLFGESEGKDGKGLFPATATFSTDLHSIGQMIQDGKRNLFETHLKIKEKEDIKLQFKKESLQNLNGRNMSSLNEIIMNSAIDAHLEDGVTNLIIEVEELNEKTMGKLIHFFELSCAISALLLGVNPFDQPGVEQYKINIKKNLSKD